MEQMLELALDRLTSIEKTQEGMGERLEGIEKIQEGMGERLGSIEKRQGSMEKRQESMEKRQESMEKRQESMGKRLENMEKRQDEIFEVVTAIEHSNSMHKAEIDKLTYKVAYIEGTVDGVGEFIQERRER